MAQTCKLYPANVIKTTISKYLVKPLKMYINTLNDVTEDIRIYHFNFYIYVIKSVMRKKEGEIYSLTFSAGDFWHFRNFVKSLRHSFAWNI